MEKVWIGLGGVLLGGVLALAKEFFVIFLTRQKQAEYLAIRVVCILDRYVDGCASVVGDEGLSCGQPNSEEYRESQAQEPEFNLSSCDVEWKSLSSALMYDILSFPNKIEEAKHVIDGAFEYAATPPDYEEYFEERQYQYALLGLDANKLGDRLRDKYNLPKRNHKNWNPVDYLNESKNRILEIRFKREQRHQISIE